MTGFAVEDESDAAVDDDVDDVDLLVDSPLTSSVPVDASFLGVVSFSSKSSSDLGVAVSTSESSCDLGVDKSRSESVCELVDLCVADATSSGSWMIS